MSCDIQSIKKRADFIKLSKEGFSSPQKGLVLQAKSNEELCTSQLIRFGVTATKKIGNAVIRNKCKRKLRVLARDVLLKHAKENSDYVLIARNTTSDRDINLLKSDLLNALKETKYIRTNI